MRKRIHAPNSSILVTFQSISFARVGAFPEEVRRPIMKFLLETAAAPSSLLPPPSQSDITVGKKGGVCDEEANGHKS